MKESERLRAAKSLIDSPKKWTKRQYADCTDYSKATCFCALGAVSYAWNGRYGDEFESTNEYLRGAAMLIDKHISSISEYNDTHTHEEVMQMFDKAIEIAESEGN